MIEDINNTKGLVRADSFATKRASCFDFEMARTPTCRAPNIEPLWSIVPLRDYLNTPTLLAKKFGVKH